MPSHKKHRVALYTLVAILSIIQITSFIILSIQISKLELKIDNGLKQTDEELRKYSDSLMGSYNVLYQDNFKQISTIIAEQEKDFEQRISLLKIDQKDFSKVIETAIKSVVTVSTEKSIGSGFIINSEGYLVTNYHVIDGQEDNIVVLNNKREIISADFIGKDEIRDIALLKIEGNYTPLALATKESLQVGEKVIAIGNPLGLSFTVTEGIISALDRAGPSGLNEYVQTDVSLNPGNSGGPLIDIEGKVVGINNFKIGGAESLGFSLESDAIKKSVNMIANTTLIK